MRLRGINRAYASLREVFQSERNVHSGISRFRANIVSERRKHCDNGREDYKAIFITDNENNLQGLFCSFSNLVVRSLRRDDYNKYQKYYNVRLVAEL